MPGRSLPSRLALLACFAVIFALPLAAARQQAPTRDQPPAPPETSGTGRISVSIVAADTGTGVKRVRVMLSGTAMAARPPAGSSMSGFASSSSIVTQSGSVVVGMTPGSPSGPPPGRVQKDGETDETGRLEFGALPAGVYSLMVSPPAGFVRPTFSTPIQLGDGESASRTVRLDRGGAIMGRVVDETGDPVARVSVMALRKDPRSPSSRIGMSGNSATTDDRGEFRVYGLAPGDYYVAANYNVPAPYSASPPEPRLGYVPTYYPGVPVLDGARLIKVRSGQDSGGIDFGLLLGKLGRVVGTVSDSTGGPAPATPGRSAYISLSPKGGEQPGFGRGSTIKPDGTFVIPDVPPGEYVVYANVVRGMGPQAEREAVAETVTVNGNEATVNLRTNTGATLSGRVVMEGTLTSPPPMPGMTTAPADPRGGAPGVNVTVRPSMTPDYLPQIFATGKSEPVSEDGVFTIVGVRGSVLINAGTAGRTLKAVRRAGQDITTTPLVLAGTENIDDLEVVLTYDTGNLLANITDGRGQPLLGAWLIAFPDDPKRWVSGSPFVRLGRAAMSPPALSSGPQGDQRLRLPAVPASASPGATTGFVRQPGQFLLTRLLPGRYYVMAMESDDNSMPFAQYDAETIAGWRRQATAVTVAVGETATVTVRAVKQSEDR